jgi:hypothetical protein
MQAGWAVTGARAETVTEIPDDDQQLPVLAADHHVKRADRSIVAGVPDRVPACLDGNGLGDVDACRRHIECTRAGSDLRPDSRRPIHAFPPSRPFRSRRLQGPILGRLDPLGRVSPPPGSSVLAASP